MAEKIPRPQSKEAGALKTEEGLEKEATREAIEKALKDGLDLIEKIPEEKKTEREKWILETVRSGLKKAEKDGKFPVDFAGLTEREGIPVDELIDYLKGICFKPVNTPGGFRLENSEYGKDRKSVV